MIDKKLVEELNDQGYFMILERPNRGICGLFHMAYTIGLVYGMDESGYEGRYCYHNLADAVSALVNWNGDGDPDDPHWIKHKGLGIDYSNPKNPEYDHIQNP